MVEGQESGGSGTSGLLNSSEGFVARMRTRALNSTHEFFASRLRGGMRVLDCGSGPGSLTIGLAERVAPGETIGIDIDPLMIERASNLAAEAGISNVHFEKADVYKLPFPDASFDAVWATRFCFTCPIPSVF